MLARYGGIIFWCIAALLFLFIATKHYWFDALPGEAQVRFWTDIAVAIGTLSLALATALSVRELRQTRVESARPRVYLVPPTAVYLSLTDHATDDKILELIAATSLDDPKSTSPEALLGGLEPGTRDLHIVRGVRLENFGKGAALNVTVRLSALRSHRESISYDLGDGALVEVRDDEFELGQKTMVQVFPVTFGSQHVYGIHPDYGEGNSVNVILVTTGLIWRALLIAYGMADQKIDRMLDRGIQICHIDITYSDIGGRRYHEVGVLVGKFGWAQYRSGSLRNSVFQIKLTVQNLVHPEKIGCYK
jgi:hypothetical protein